MSATAKSVLDQFYGALQNRSVRRREVDWASLRTEVHALAGTAQDPEELNPAILRALTVMNDRHSRYVSRRGTLLRYRPVTCTAPNRTVPALPADVGYVHVNYFGGTAVQSAAFATQLQDSIRAQDRDGLAGWIIDLRGNTGGSMWPMVAGIGPLLADSLFGYFIDPDNSREPLVYRNGSSLLNGSVLATAQRPYVVRNRAARVAVLTEQLTASSGEAVAIAFQARPNTRTLGSAS